MERVTNEQIRDAKAGTDSLVYQELIKRRDEERLQDAIQNTVGCLIREGCEGFSSMTPNDCPVAGCEALFSKNNLRVENETACVSPVHKPQQKYKC